MAKLSLSTISINFPFQLASVVSEPDFSTSRALFNFDVVVVRPYALVKQTYTGRSGGEFQVQWSDYGSAKTEIKSKVEDIARLLDQGGLLVVVLDVLQVLKCRTGGYSGGTIYTATNYDFLDEHFFRAVRNGTGDRVRCNGTDPFTKVVKASTLLWTAFITDRIPYPFEDSTVFATNGTNSIVGAAVPVRAGYIVFLPNFKHLDEQSFFEACLDYRSRREGTPVPAWAPSVYLPGEADGEQDLESLELKIKGLRDDRERKLAALDALVGYKKLLFEKGKSQLEPIVLKALNELGFQTSPAEKITGTNFEIDGRTKVGSLPGIVETKGSKNQITLDEFSPFTSKILADFQATGVHSKGILVGNGLCLDSPAGRLRSGVFSPHVLDAAKRNSIALVNSVELYAVVCSALEGQIADLGDVRESILTANGYADLRRFIMKSPFPTK